LQNGTLLGTTTGVIARSFAAVARASDIDAVAEDVAILDDHISDDDSNAELDPVVHLNRAITLRHCGLHFGGTAQGVDDAGEFHQQTIAHCLDDPAVMLGNSGIRQLGPDRRKPSEGSTLVGADQPRIPHHVGGEDRGKAAGGRHGRPGARFSRVEINPNCRRSPTLLQVIVRCPPSG
jgi:hypothetical protein